MKKRLIAGIAGGALAVAIAIQFVPTDRTNPPVIRAIAWDSEETEALVRRACYDCHSNETRWPGYSRIAPASWLIAKDVDEGREHLNFSAWDGPNEGLDEIIEMIESGEMPQKRYVLLHPEARLTDRERARLLRGLRATLAADPPAAEAHEDEHE